MKKILGVKSPGRFERDINTRFFQKMADAHRRRNYLSSLKINGRWFEERAGLKERVVRAFQGLLSSPFQGWFKMNVW